SSRPPPREGRLAETEKHNPKWRIATPSVPVPRLPPEARQPGEKEKSMSNSFNARSTLEVGGKSYEIYRLDALEKQYKVSRLPYSLKVLLENLLRHEDGKAVKAADIEALAKWDPKAKPADEIAFTPARVLMQDF